jgi:GTP-binding protein
MVVVTKCELPGADEIRSRLSEVTDGEVVAISAVTGQGLDQLLWRIAEMLDQRKLAAEAPAEMKPV